MRCTSHIAVILSELDPTSTTEPTHLPQIGSGTLVVSAALLMLASLTGCQPDNVVFEIGNTSGGKLHNVKLIYPGGDLSFGTLEDSTYTATYRHFDGGGDLAISYATDDGQTYSSSGPHVTGNEKGEVKVRIEGSYANFDTKFEESQQ